MMHKYRARKLHSKLFLKKKQKKAIKKCRSMLFGRFFVVLKNLNDV